MKRKDRRQHEREMEAARREASLFPIDMRKLLAVDTFRAEIIKAATVAEKQSREGGGRGCNE